VRRMPSTLTTFLLGGLFSAFLLHSWALGSPLKRSHPYRWVGVRRELAWFAGWVGGGGVGWGAMQGCVNARGWAHVEVFVGLNQSLLWPSPFLCAPLPPNQVHDGVQ
jgi:hypothetical protein